MLVEIKISFNPNEETLEQAVSKLLNGKKPNVSTDAPAEEKNVKPMPDVKVESKPEVKTDAKTEKKPEPKAEDKPAPVEQVTKTDVRAIATAISKAGKKAELKAALESFGATKLSDVSEADYPALKKKLEAINA